MKNFGDFWDNNLNTIAIPVIQDAKDKHLRGIKEERYRKKC